MGMIIKPLVTEKMTAISEKFNRFGFIVRPEANKLEIKSEIEALFGWVCIISTVFLCILLSYRLWENHHEKLMKKHTIAIEP